MFYIEKRFYFAAGHVLKHHNGKCRENHGHTYKIKITIKGKKLAISGARKNMVCDFQEISAVVNPMIEQYFDHQWLNDTLKTDSPTAEFIAKWIYDYLKPSFPNLYSVVVHETETASVIYTE